MCPISATLVEFTPDIIEAYRDIPQLASFLHLPVQSGSDKILRLMKRSHTVKDYRDIIANLRKVRPDIKISSDFIIGFPGETQEDFMDTINLIKDIDFDNSFSFIYSPRPGTPAADLPDSVTMEEKKQRLSVLQNIITQNALRYSRLTVGTIQKVLVEGPSKKNIMDLCGRTEDNRVVNFHGSPELIGEFVDIEITDAFANSLRGSVKSRLSFTA